jgi:RNA polymerase sigma factor (sigma-70 family)
MDEALKRHWLLAQRDPGSHPAQFSSDSTEDQRLLEALHRNYARLRKFIRQRVADRSEAEDILQDVFYELVEAYRMMNPIEQVTAWLFRVARNRITDLFRRKQREEQRNAPAPITEDGVDVGLEELLPSPDAGPEAAYIQGVLLDEIETALDDLPQEQREVFVAHELLGHSFEDISAKTGVGVNTLLSRKHHAVRQLRKRLRAIYDEFLKG